MKWCKVAKRFIRGPRGLVPLVCLAGMAMVVAGCSLDSILKSDELPPDVTDPAITQTPEGAVAAYYGTIRQFRRAFAGVLPGVGAGTSLVSFVVITGLLSDELQHLPITFSSSRADMRDMPEGERTSGDAYSRLQRVRGQAAQAIGLLTRYAPGQEALTGHVYSLQGYAEISLAELFCSGTPLSTLDFDGDFTYKSGSTTEEIFTHSVALFDTALALSADSTHFVYLAHAGRARALLALGEFTEAAAAAAEVPDGYSYAVSYSATGGTSANPESDRNFARTPREFSFPDREGLNGLDYVSSGDPRKTATKYAADGTTAIVLASAVEARLIEAEAALQSGGTWLERLNALRTNGTFTTRPNAADPTKTDTLWNAGSGGVAGLAPLNDPIADDARVDLVFRERAFWLFLTGHRQGDLRRLIRQYGRRQEQIYPIGAYPSSTPGLSYGTDVTMPVPPEESLLNPHFTGCGTRGA